MNKYHVVMMMDNGNIYSRFIKAESYEIAGSKMFRETIFVYEPNQTVGPIMINKIGGEQNE